MRFFIVDISIVHILIVDLGDIPLLPIFLSSTGQLPLSTHHCDHPRHFWDSPTDAAGDDTSAQLCVDSPAETMPAQDETQPQIYVALSGGGAIRVENLQVRMMIYVLDMFFEQGVFEVCLFIHAMDARLTLLETNIPILQSGETLTKNWFLHRPNPYLGGSG